MNFFLALPVAVAAGWALGALIELILLRPLRGADIDTTMLVMIGAWIVDADPERCDLGRRREIHHDAVSGRAVGDRAGFGVVAAPVRAGGRRAPDRRDLSSDQPHQARQRHARDVPGSRHRRADGRQCRPHPYCDLCDRLEPGGRGRRPARPGLCGLADMGDLAALKAFAIVILGGLGNITGATIGGSSWRSPKSSAPATSRPATATRWAFSSSSRC